MRKIISIATSIFMIFFLLPLNASALSVSAASAVVIDSLTGRVLYSYNCHTKMGMASTTKIMTALIALEYGKLDELVTVSTNAAYQEGSSMYLKPGENIPLSDLLYGLMLPSGNDAAVAIAEHISGNVEAFAAIMTNRAHELGANDTSFKNPNGLDAQGHYTTAYDLAIITKKAMEFEKFREIVSCKGKQIGERYLSNHNKLLSMYNGATGVKTGYTKSTGRSLVSSAERDGFRIIAVTLNAPNDWNDHTTMLNYAFDNYKPLAVAEKGTSAGKVTVADGVIKSVPAIYGDSLTVHLTEDEKSRLSLKADYTGTLNAPVLEGRNLGTLTVTVDGTLIGTVPIVAGGTSIKKKPPSFLKRLNIVFWDWLLLYRHNKTAV